MHPTRPEENEPVPELGAPRAGADPTPRRPRGPVRAFLGVPLFYKILLANALIVVLGTVGGTWVTTTYVRHTPYRSIFDLVTLLVVGGVLLTVLVNALILRLALSPLQLLEDTAARVQGGDLDARTPLSPLADRELERLTGTFNGMLDTMDLYRQRLRDVAVRALTAAEEERKRIARELHDETAQMLAALLIRVRIVRNSSDPEALDTLLEEMRQEIGRSLEGIRRFARGLRPPALDELGLGPAVESHARNLSESVGIGIRVEADPLEGALTPEAELAIYRIVQEALSNVVRHSGATRATVRLARASGAVVATVQDDGRGFDVAGVMAGDRQGLGLFGMQERAAYLGGKVEIDSRAGVGTRVRAEVPAAGAGA
ncbi:MAG: HAMP domain-containing protein [Gemmatimonadetes bacterium]|nr:HAMP domain-containing protein [Gemmatimonadota bacterium]